MSARDDAPASKVNPATAVKDSHGIPLVSMSQSANSGLHRVVPVSGSPKPPTAAFDSAL